MKTHYRTEKGYRRRPGRGGCPVYRIRMSPEEVTERRLMYGLIGTLAAMACSLVLWMVSLI